jgi:tRNA 2-selenouridine synthase
MSLNLISAEQALRELDVFDTVIDARSEDEYAQDRLPGAVNWPTLNNEERRVVGTTYKQIDAFEARKRGAAMAARNIAAHIEREVIDKPRSWRPLAYCWRGGQRSGALALILDQIGFRVTLVQGGYKAYRNAVLRALPGLAQGLSYRVICGATGSGKTRLLHALAAAGAQVLDLEGLANHRSSVLGAIPGQPQPSQKQFESRLWQVLSRLDPAQPVFVESESKKIGNLSVPLELMAALRASPCINLELPEDERVALLMEDYDFFLHNADTLCDRLQALTAIRGKQVVEEWKALAQAGQWAPMVQQLLQQHYDPAYLQSMRKNFTRFEAMQTVNAADRSPQEFARLAVELAADSRFAR